MNKEPSLWETSKHLNRVVRRALKRCNKKLEKQNNELSNAENWKVYRQLGDTLLANLRSLKKGDKTVTLKNVHTNIENDISMNPGISPKRNADHYYLRARKGERGIKTIKAQVQKTNGEIDFLTGTQKSLTTIINSFPEFLKISSESKSELTDNYNISEDIKNKLTEIENELIEKSYIPVKPSSKSKSSPVDKFRRYTIDKWTVLIGKNDVQNDELTLHIAKPGDLWFHVYGSPGSHVVLRRNTREETIPHHVIEHTARLTAWFSKQKHSLKVPVNYTEKRYVRKPRKSPPGLVVIEREKTLFVKPLKP